MRKRSPEGAAERTRDTVNEDEVTEEEVAAALAAVSALGARRAEAEGAQAPGASGWVRASRLVARREPLQRGPWRMSGRISRRNRA